MTDAELNRRRRGEQLRRQRMVERAAEQMLDAINCALHFLEHNYTDDVDGVPMYRTMPEWMELRSAANAAEGRNLECDLPLSQLRGIDNTEGGE